MHKTKDKSGICQIFLLLQIKRFFTLLGMRGYLKSFLLLCLLCNTGTVWAVAKGGACDTTNTCDANLYCDATTNKCTSCSEKTSGAFPESGAGSTKIEQCYISCSDKPTTLGTWIRKSPKVFYNQNNNGCDWALTCVTNAEPAGDVCKCKANYEGTTSCTGKCYHITLKKNLTNFMETDKHLYVKYDNGFYTNNACSGTPLNSSSTWITPSYNWWQTFTGYSTEQNGGAYRFGPNGHPTNGTTNTTFTGDTTLYGQWNKSDYTVKYFDTTGTTQIGGTQTCKIDSAPNDTTIKGTCQARETSISYDSGETIVGWSKTKNSTNKTYDFGANIDPDASSQTIILYAVLKPCPAGYYCNATDGRKECPAGSTSATGASAQTQCYISNATQFRDKNGTFKLPIGDIEYK